MRRRLLPFILVLGLGFAPSAFADDCAGPIYEFDPNCGGLNVNCLQADCWDISFGQDGSEYQCCPPFPETPELPFGNFAWLALFSLLGFAAWEFVQGRRARVQR